MTIAPILMCKDVFDVMVAIMGAVGLDLSYKSYPYYRDYNQLRETEGFPHFNQRYIEQVEFSEYRSKHMNNYSQYEQRDMNRADMNHAPYENTAPNADNSPPVNNTPIVNNTPPVNDMPGINYSAYPKSSGNSGGYDGMPELDLGGSTAANAPAGRFTPKDVKAGAISDSSVKIKYKGGS